MNQIIQALQQQAKEIYPEVIQIRRSIHSCPELAFEEHQTAKLIIDKLKIIGLDYKTEVAQTGVVAWLKGKHEGPTLALRADMDALPILEENNVDYKSRNEGKMHACGHDAHTASLLGVAKLLTQHTEHIHGTVQFIFQPSEEKLPGGASVMIQEGILNGVSSIIGQHVMPVIDVGKIGICAGKYMASADELYITIEGKGGHGAQPHTTIDPVIIASHIVVALQSLVSRNADPRMPSVLSIGKMIANGATNIIPNSVYLEGTFRTFDENWRAKAKEQIANVVQHTAQAFGGKAQIEIKHGYPVLYNNEELTGRAKQNIISYMGEENVEDLSLWMASEDFAYYTQQIPGCFYRLGTRNEAKGIIHGLHTPKFNIDESALLHATGLMAWLAIQELHPQ